ncbi:MAG TPA: hypothetical protein VI544_00575 [Candidatus Nanoarchaeia archaeon]|nr:hypothetical protein [Candidatus Nanoarchaeia archaeon]
MKDEERIFYWAYNKLLWMLAGCILLLGVWITISFSMLTLEGKTRTAAFIFTISFISFACYVWEKREFYSRQIQER